GEAVHKYHKMGGRDAEQALFEKADTERQDEDGQEDRLRHGQNEMDDRVERFGEMKPFTEKESGRDGKRCSDEEGDRHFASREPEVGNKSRVMQESPEDDAPLRERRKQGSVDQGQPRGKLPSAQEDNCKRQVACNSRTHRRILPVSVIPRSRR